MKRVINLKWCKIDKIPKNINYINQLVSGYRENVIYYHIPLIDEFNQKNKVDYIVLGWDAFKTCSIFKEKGYLSENLENYLKISDLLYIYKKYRFVKKMSIKNIDLFYVKNDFNFKGENVFFLLKYWIEFYFCGDLINKISMFVALKNYYSLKKAKAICPYGDLNFDLSRIAYELLKIKKDKVSNNILVYRCPGIGNSLGFFGEYDFKVSELRFMQGFLIYNKFKNVYPIHKYKIVGSLYDSYLKKYENDRNIEFYNLIPKNFKTLLLILPGLTRGFCSMSEVYEVVDKMINFIKNKNVFLIIKPHPKTNIISIINNFAKRKIDNLKLVDKNVPIHNFLNISDIIINRISTVGHEAMILKKPVISICFNKNYFFQEDYFDFSVEKFNNCNDMFNLLEKILSDNNEFKKWKDYRLREQERYLKESIYVNHIKPETLIAETVLDELEKV